MAASLPLMLLATSSIIFSLASAGNFNNDFDITWGDGRDKTFNNGQSLTLSLDKYSGSGFQSKQEYLFGKFEIQLKLVPGNSAGTVTTLYLSSQGPTHDEIDLEFLGNSTGEPYTLHTNVFAHGKGNCEQQLRLHPLTPQTHHLLSGRLPNQRFQESSVQRGRLPHQPAIEDLLQPLERRRLATQGGRVKSDWSKASFTASYRNFNTQTSNGKPASVSSGGAWYNKELDSIIRSWTLQTTIDSDGCRVTS